MKDLMHNLNYLNFQEILQMLFIGEVLVEIAVNVWSCPTFCCPNAYMIRYDLIQKTLKVMRVSEVCLLC